jgi:NAD-dependent deacetylase
VSEFFDPYMGVAIDFMRYAKKIVVLSGAGISTDSGIPDFRSPGGLWSKYDPLKYANYNIFLKEPELYWEMEREMTPIFSNAKPNPAHKALVDLERRNTLKAIITQNIDGFHQMAGSKVPIIEMHGNVYNAHCLDCGTKIKRGYILKRLKMGEKVPECPECGGRIKTGVLLFNEPFGDQVINDALRYARDCDLMLILGTSLLVYPTNLVPLVAVKNGAKLIFINYSPTPYDKYAAVRLLGNVSKLLPELVKIMLKQTLG